MASVFLQTILQLDTTIFGNTVEQYLLYAGTVVLFILGGRILQYILDIYGKRLAAKTKSDWDDILIDVISTPARFLLTTAGLVIAAELFLTFSSPEIEAFYYNVVGLLFLGVITWSLIKLVDIFAERVLMKLAAQTKSNLDDQLVPLFKRAAKYLIVILALLLAMSNFGYDITALLAGLGIGGLAVAFAAQETIKDIFGGIVIFSNKTFLVGDRITVDNITGVVEQINMRTTRL
ncbi:MAG: mechanosensitive ion channel, partial [archaeon]|nr:mechanosensitive ion channel [archaeon]